MWSPSTLKKVNAPKKPQMEPRQQVSANQRKVRLAQIEAILSNHGLESTLQSFIEALEKLMKVRGKSVSEIFVLEGLKGVLSGYLRRYEPEDE